MDRLGELHKAAAGCYAAALRDIAGYAVELDSMEAAEFRRSVESMAGQWREADSPEKMRGVQSSLTSGIRTYRDRCAARLDRLRKDLTASIKALEAFTASIASSGENHQTQIETELHHLERLAEEDSLDEIRRGVRMATAEIAASLERMQRNTQMVIAQLRDEIRLLHEAQNPRRSAQPATEFFSRATIDQSIDQFLARKQPFCLLFVNVRNLQRVESRLPRGVVERAVEELMSRLQGVAGRGAVVGRWARQSLVAIVDPQPGGGMALTREVTRKLSGGYSVQEDGSTHEVTLEITVGTLHRAADDEPSAFAKKLAQLSAALEQA